MANSSGNSPCSSANPVLPASALWTTVTSTRSTKTPSTTYSRGIQSLPPRLKWKRTSAVRKRRGRERRGEMVRRLSRLAVAVFTCSLTLPGQHARVLPTERMCSQEEHRRGGSARHGDTDDSADSLAWGPNLAVY